MSDASKSEFEEAVGGPDHLDDDESMEAAQLWLQSISSAPAGCEPEAIPIPESVKQGLLDYYADAVLAVGQAHDASTQQEADQDGKEVEGRSGLGDVGGAPEPGGRCARPDDVPLRMAEQAEQPRDDEEPVRIGSVRRLGRNVLLQDLMLNQLLSSLTVSSLAFYGRHSLNATRVVPVFNGGALAVLHRFSAAIVWAARGGHSLLFFCSCGGPRRATFVEAAVRKGESSTCDHAVSLQSAFQALAAQLALSSLLELAEKFPVVLSTAGRSSTKPLVERVGTMRNERAVWAVCAMGAWCALVQPVKSASSQAPRCQNVRCASRMRCIHALAYFQHCARHEELEDHDEEPYNEDGIWRERRGENGAHPTPVLAAESEEAERIWRRSRNMLPCRGEVRSCRIFDSYGRAGRDCPSGRGTLPGILHERSCIACGQLRGDRALQITKATLFTMGGIVDVRIGSWICECKEKVRYDGADSALFAFSSKTVYTRVYLDVVLHIALASRSSFTAATAAMAFSLYVTAGLPPGAVGNTRQMIIHATGLLTETFIVPPATYACRRCLSEGGLRQYLTLIADGQVLGFFKEMARPFVRHLVDNPVVNVLISSGCAVKTASVRSAVRKRCAMDVHKSTALTATELNAIANFIIASSEVDSSEREPDDLEIGNSSAARAAWAASFIFSSFFRLGQPTDGDDSSTDGSSGDDSSDTTSVLSTTNAETSETSPGDCDSGSEKCQDDAVGKQQRQLPDSVCVRMKGAVGDEDDDELVLNERWRVVQRFVANFIAEPVIGMFAGCDRAGVVELATALIEGKPYAEWKCLTGPVEQVSLVWPFLFQVADDLDADFNFERAIGELLLFAADSDRRMEQLWFEKASDSQKAFAAKWEHTDRLKYKQWEREESITPPKIRLRTHPLSEMRAVAQEEERLSGSIFPSLDPVRPFTYDSTAAELRKKKATQKRQKRRHTTRIAPTLSSGSDDRGQSRLGRKRLKGHQRTKDTKPVNDDDCRHRFDASNVFTPGMVNILCPHGLLVGFEMLDHAESPACVAEILARRLSVLPKVIYFDTACQASRNATRRMPWLLRQSLVVWFLDRFHQPKHLCSDMFNPDEYPEISSLHNTAVAESRHALNKPLQNQVSYMTQDRFISHMRLYGALNNLRVQLRHHLQSSDTAPTPQVGHIPLPRFFHEHVVAHCERRGCPCTQGQQSAVAEHALQLEKVGQNAEQLGMDPVGEAVCAEIGPVDVVPAGETGGDAPADRADARGSTGGISLEAETAGGSGAAAS